MKLLKFRVILLVLGFTLSVADSSFARVNRGRESSITREIAATTQMSAPIFAPASTNQPPWALGYSLVSNLTGTNSAVTGLMRFSNRDFLQGFFVIPTTSPFRITAAAAYKKTIAESQNAGFHLGGGIGLGVADKKTVGKGSAFLFTLSALGGFHFNLAGAPHVQVHVDGGPTFRLQDGATDFAVDSLSPVLGASIVYWF